MIYKNQKLHREDYIFFLLPDAPHILPNEIRIQDSLNKSAPDFHVLVMHGVFTPAQSPDPTAQIDKPVNPKARNIAASNNFYFIYFSKNLQLR
jgi:hypothetical protein